MKLVVTTPLAAVIDASDVVHVRAEDSTGSFGLLQGHADFITALEVSVLIWHRADGIEHYVALRGGMLEMRDGDSVSVATPEAVPGDDLHQLESEALERFRRRLDDERAARVDAERLHLAAIRQIIRLLRPERTHSVASRAVPDGGGPDSGGIEP